jgi:hypothetical protein
MDITDLRQITELTDTKIAALTQNPVVNITTPYMVLMIEGTWKCANRQDVEEFLSKFTGQKGLWRIKKRYGDDTENANNISLSSNLNMDSILENF